MSVTRPTLNGPPPVVVVPEVVVVLPEELFDEPPQPAAARTRMATRAASESFCTVISRFASRSGLRRFYAGGAWRAASARMSRQRAKSTWCVPSTTRSSASGSSRAYTIADRGRADAVVRTPPQCDRRTNLGQREVPRPAEVGELAREPQPPVAERLRASTRVRVVCQRVPGRRWRPPAPVLERASRDPRREPRHAHQPLNVTRQRADLVRRRHRADECDAADALRGDRRERERMRATGRPPDQPEAVRVEHRRGLLGPTAQRTATRGRAAAVERKQPHTEARRNRVVRDGARGANRRRRAGRRRQCRRDRRRRRTSSPPAQQDARLAASVVVVVDPLDLEAERLVEGDRALVDRRRDRADDRSRRAPRRRTARRARGRGPAARRAGSTPTKWMYASSSCVCERKPQRNPRARPSVLGDERRVAEVDEEELRQHRRHRPAAPPIVDNCNHGCVIRRLAGRISTRSPSTT